MELMQCWCVAEILFTMLRVRQKSIVRQVGNEKIIVFCIRKLEMAWVSVNGNPNECGLIDTENTKEKENREKKIPYGIVGDNEFSPCVF